MRAALLIALALATPPAALAQANPVSAPAPAVSLGDRAAQLPAVLGGSVGYAEYFTPEFLAAVPPAQLKAVIDGVVAQHGAVQAIDRVEAQDSVRGTVFVRFERSVGRFQMTIDPASGGRVAGLLVTGFTSNDDSIAKIVEEIRSLPGTTNLLITPLGEAQAKPLVAHNPDTVLAIGSTFKLYILAELAAQVQRRKLGWDRVTAVDRKSFSSKATEHWPHGAPVTLHSLASWMISVSDNGATDILLDVLGREAVGKRLVSIGNSAAPRNLPFLNTVEAFALKSDANAALRTQYLAANETEQRRLLDSAADKLTLAEISGEMFIGKPLHIDTIEWFASAHDLARLLDTFRAPAMADARGIMAINPGIARDSTAGWSYLGYKGGSEAGVISMSFLLQSKAGRWYAVTGGWNNVAAPVDNGQFAGLMQRLVDQLAKDVVAR
jgi:beta-lactamase class A